MREILNRCSRTAWPCSCTASITSGMQEQSNKNWQNLSLVGLLRFRTSSEIAGTFLEYLMVKFTSFSRTGARPEQDWRMWGRSSTVAEHPGERRQNPCLFLDQCLQRLSLLYRPLIICAWMVAIETFAGEDPAVVQRG